LVLRCHPDAVFDHWERLFELLHRGMTVVPEGTGKMSLMALIFRIRCLGPEDIPQAYVQMKLSRSILDQNLKLTSPGRFPALVAGTDHHPT
jgi:hypothetical protein